MKAPKVNKKDSKSIKKAEERSTIDSADIARFETLKEQWWNETGPMRPLHKLNPARMQYIRESILRHFELKSINPPLRGLSIADIGCGGGIVAEPLARMGADVTGIDAGAENIRIASAHAEAQGINIDYRAMTVEALAKTKAQFDVVTALEIVEHVADVDLFIQACAKILRPGGLLILSTLNRTPQSYLLGIVAAEHILKWVPQGTHEWRQFLKPSELAAHVQNHGLSVDNVTGLVYNILQDDFALSETDMKVNYFMTAAKP